MKLTLEDKSRGIKIAWFLMIITVGDLLNQIKETLDTANIVSHSYEIGLEAGYSIGSKLGLVFLLSIGIFLYTRTKKRKLGYSVWGPKIIDFVLAVILAINFVFPLLSGRWVNGTSDDVLAFFYVSISLIAYVYALLAKPKIYLEQRLKEDGKV